jgi:hypothetical protein
MPDDLERRTTEMLLRVNSFGIENAAVIARFAKAVEAFARIQTAVTLLESLGVFRSSSAETKFSQSARRKMWRNELHNDMSPIARTAVQITRENPDFVNKFHLPRADKSDMNWLETARAWTQDLPPVEQLFLDLAHLPDFIADLISDTDAFEQAIRGQDTSNRDRIEANADIDDVVAGALKDVRTLKIMMPNIFHGQPGKLAEWASASHIEKAPKGAPRNSPTP